MGMPLELNTMIVTKGLEKRMDENLFVLEKAGYRLYPLDIPISVHKTKEGERTGTGVIRKVELVNNQTRITYELVKLNSTN
ncbi:DUF2584 domain-containing protein [Metabacillus iocasae]|uniref:DUF2584 domain-containing protein n=1 Tax=Priestia iocasae TaxID=2291674 RepID=A0ABS2QZH1_9BACI|nr:DUF2584 domain-containing protein [Metabacillus iocasae]MBM7704840.1 hypothetical protein [Metabacillus iocasae]